MSRPQRVPRDQLRQAILDAARGILDREGAPGLSARAIAREVGYTAASIYNVFASMSDILMEVNRETFAQLEKLFETLPENEPPAARLHLLCQAYISFMRRNPARWSALFGGQRERDAFPEWYVGAIDQLMNRLAALLTDHAPGLAPVAALRAAELLFITIHGLVSLDVGRRLDMFTRRPASDLAQSALEATLVSLG